MHENARADPLLTGALRARRLAGCLLVLRAGSLAIAAGAASAAGSAPVTASAADTVQRVVLPDDVVPRRYDIEIRPDAAHLSLRGSVKIRIEVLRSTSLVTLNAVDLVLDQVTLDGERVHPRIESDARRQQLTLRFAVALLPGEHTLSIDYRGRIHQQAAGLFALDYETRGGRRRALYTQFESGDARRFLPCWDQPDRKAVFALSAVVPSESMAVSNMPIARTTALARGLKRVKFAPSPSMSSYLLFFASGDFERSHRRLGRIDVGVIVKRGDLATADFALDAATQILPYYNDYFGARYPLAKLDLIAAPAGPAFGAMENWGAILFTEHDMLLDPRVSTESDRQYAYEVVAHEMAHQWFGNLVTMAWWDDLWLNEGFATWMSHKVIQRFHPEWEVWLRNEADVRKAMTQDAGAGSHPIVAPVRDVGEADAAFDAIAYDKAAAVIRMIEAYVGEDTFRDGVRAYMARYARSSTTSADLWHELEVASSVPLAGIAQDFTLQAGVPMIDVKESESDGAVTLSQDRFGTDAASRATRSWRVPVVVAAGAGAARRMIVSAQQPMTLPAAPELLLNAGRTGYFISQYPPQSLRRLLDRLPKLAAEDQLGLLGDTSALANAGYAPMASLLELVAALPADADPAVWSAVCGELIALARRYDDGAPADAYRRWVKARLAPVLKRVGWDRQPGENDNTATLRAKVLTALSEADDEVVIDEARRRFERFAAAPETLQGDVRSTVLTVVAVHADAAAWERLHAMARGSKSTLEQEQIYQMLGSARDRALAQRALDLAISEEAPRTVAPNIVQAVAVRHAAATFDFVASHWSRLKPLVVSGYLNRFAPTIAAGSDNPDTAARLTEFSQRVGSDCDAGEVRKAIASIRYLTSIKQQRLTEIDRWLGEHSS